MKHPSFRIETFSVKLVSIKHKRFHMFKEINYEKKRSNTAAETINSMGLLKTEDRCENLMLKLRLANSDSMVDAHFGKYSKIRVAESFERIVSSPLPPALVSLVDPGC